MKKKTSIIIGLTVISIILLVVILFIFSIQNSKDCDQFVIDTYEIASGIDIPKLTDADCLFDDKVNTRIGIYTIDKQSTNLENYIKKNGFSKIDIENKNTLWSIAFLIKNDVSLPDSSGILYQLSGERKSDKWQCILDTKSGKMWFEIKWN